MSFVFVLVGSSVFVVKMRPMGDFIEFEVVLSFRDLGCDDFFVESVIWYEVVKTRSREIHTVWRVFALMRPVHFDFLLFFCYGLTKEKC